MKAYPVKYDGSDAAVKTALNAVPECTNVAGREYLEFPLLAGSTFAGGAAMSQGAARVIAAGTRSGGKAIIDKVTKLPTGQTLGATFAPGALVYCLSVYHPTMAGDHDPCT